MIACPRRYKQPVQLGRSGFDLVDLDEVEDISGALVPVRRAIGCVPDQPELLDLGGPVGSGRDGFTVHGYSPIPPKACADDPKPPRLTPPEADEPPAKEVNAAARP